MGKTAIAFLCSVKPPAGFMSFAQELEQSNKYEVFYVMDDNKHTDHHLDRFMHKFVQIPDEESKSNGFWGTVLYYPNRACAKDKALYYFSRIATEYEFVWLIEQDVFIPSNQTVQWIDAKYPARDLVSPRFDMRVIRPGLPNGWHWDKVQSAIKLPPPWANGMTCAIRVSRNFLNELDDYVTKNKQLFMDEVLFATISLHYNLSTVMAPELRGVTWLSRDFYYNEVQDVTRMFHPIKNQERQLDFRRRLQNHEPPEPTAPPTMAPSKNTANAKNAPSNTDLLLVGAVMDNYILLSGLSLCLMLAFFVVYKFRRSSII